MTELSARGRLSYRRPVRRALLAFILREGMARGIERFSVDRVDANDGAWMGHLRELGFEPELAFQVMTRFRQPPERGATQP